MGFYWDVLRPWLTGTIALIARCRSFVAFDRNNLGTLGRFASAVLLRHFFSLQLAEYETEKVLCWVIPLSLNRKSKKVLFVPEVKVGEYYLWSVGL